MRTVLVPLLRCPRCGGGLQLAGGGAAAEVDDGALECGCGARFPIIGGVPRLLPEERAPVDGALGQVRDSFSFKWTNLPRWGFDREEVRAFNQAWFYAKVGCQDVAVFARYIAPRRRILDAGTGLGGKVAHMAEINPEALVVGVDISESVVPAHENVHHLANAHIVQADLTRLPFPEGFFDLIVCDGVLHHTPDPRGAFLALVKWLAPEGEIAIHVYRRLGPVREFCDDLLRAHCAAVPPEEAWAFSLPFTRFGESLARQGVEIEVPEDLPVLGIRKGRYNLQRFIYQHVFKCFWNDGFSFDENNMVNFDWYHPRFAFRHDEDEVLGWFREAGLREVRAHRANGNGISVVGRR